MLTGMGLSNGLGCDPSGTVVYYIGGPTRVGVFAAATPYRAS